MRGEMPAKKRGKKIGNTPCGFLPPDDPAYSTGLMVAGIPVEKQREKKVHHLNRRVTRIFYRRY